MIREQLKTLPAFKLNVLMFGSARTEWGHSANPQLAWHSYHQEPVVICAVALHPSTANASMKQYECGRTQP
jgi:hypothetical protein